MNDDEADSRKDARNPLESAAAYLRVDRGASAPELGGSDRARIGAEQRERLIEWAGLNGRLSDARAEGGDDFCGYLQLEGLVAGNEHAVIFPEVESDPVIKITHADCFGKAYPRVDGIPKHCDATPVEYFTRQLLSNEVFSDDVRL